MLKYELPGKIYMPRRVSRETLRLNDLKSIKTLNQHDQRSELEKYGGEVTLTGNLNIKDSRNIIKVSDPFFKEILEIWSEANYEEKIVSDYHFRSSPLWYNSLIRVGNRPVFLTNGSLKG